MKKIIQLSLISTLLLSTLSVLPATQVSAETTEEINQKQQELDSKSATVENGIEATEESLKSLETEKSTLEKEVQSLQKQIDEVMKKLEEQQVNLKDSEVKINELKEKIATLEDRIQQRTQKLENQARFVQTDGDTHSLATIVLTAENFSDLIGKVTAVTQLVYANKQIVTDQENDQKELKTAETAAINEKKIAENLKNEIERSKNNLYAQKSELDDKILQIATKYQLTEAEKNTLISEKNTIATQTSKLTSDLKAEQDRIVAEQAAKVAADKKAEEMATPTTNTPPVSNEGTPTPPNTGGTTFIRPSNGYVSSPFGYRSGPFTGAQTFHKGIDLAGSGAIKAAADGVVEYSNYNNGGYGYLVIINHGAINGVNYQTYYAHMAPGSLTMVAGQTVRQGQQIGVMGTSGSSTGVHLHFEVRENGTPVNPAPFIGL
ncbi:peptidase M23 [Carnobacterium divergens]|uniref:murein hydrolase activator EnvC family protein n=1 Tax=Carnobacterium divergens TaxID=2748 RepID=UPI001072E9E2|nr:peptidoglycan DD-metalloendopeptidase family protein [Carnobacterium divergens]MDT1995410.1 peptidoglycan DD-metalloendopeptidase family protein [Carnobacterium divergens]TFI62188.1 peptidase M23 [Carnobacterium divergens]TFI62286.1 peptidase M23 [Carnobacterium divergens]TFI78030.1 peptidase M23 [Carnobacterium divergens]TFI87405.1 peptidase M23 [Carnobacterium divergens]